MVKSNVTCNNSQHKQTVMLMMQQTICSIQRTYNPPTPPHTDTCDSLLARGLYTNTAGRNLVVPGDDITYALTNLPLPFLAATSASLSRTTGTLFT